MFNWIAQQAQRLWNWKKAQDADDDDIIDQAESVDDGTYSKTAQEISEHIDSSSDPHSTIPSQTGNSGKYLTTNGSTTSWGSVSGGGSSTKTVTYGDTIAIGDILYQKPADAKWYRAIANITSVSESANVMAVATESGVADDTKEVYMIKEIVTANTTFSANQEGKELFLSGSSAGDYSTTAPTTSGYVVICVGKIYSTTQFTFDPDYRYTI